MLFFLDTGSLEEIRTASRWGLLDGVTTNPSLVGKEGMDHRALIREIASITSGPISVETTSEVAEESGPGRSRARECSCRIGGVR